MSTDKINNNTGIKTVSPLLGIGIFILPIVFSWVTLKRGYSIKSRVLSFVWLILILVISFLPTQNDNPPTVSSASAALNTPLQLSFAEVMDEMNDFSEEAGEFVLYSEKPLKFKLSAKDAENQKDKYKRSNVNRAFLYGVYRAFIHTNEDEVTVIANALDIISVNPFKAKENDEFLIEATISRAQALKALQEIMPGVKKIEDVVEDKDVGGIILKDVWTDEFENIYHDDVGQEKLVRTLKSVANKSE